MSLCGTEVLISGRPRFGSVAVWGWNGSSGSGFQFRQFLFKKRFSVFQHRLTRKDGSGSGFGSWKTVPAFPVPLSVSGKTVPTVPVSGSSSVPEPPCYLGSPHTPTICMRYICYLCEVHSESGVFFWQRCFCPLAKAGGFVTRKWRK